VARFYDYQEVLNASQQVDQASGSSHTCLCSPSAGYHCILAGSHLRVLEWLLACSLRIKFGMGMRWS